MTARTKKTGWIGRKLSQIKGHDGSLPRGWLLAMILAFAATLSVPASVRADMTIILDTFDTYSVGNLPIGPGETWTFLDLYGSSGYWPAIEYEDANRGNILRILSPGSSQRRNIGTIVDIPALDPDERLELSWDMRLNDESSFFFLEIVDRWFTPSGGFGEVTRDPRAPVWQLGGISNRSGLAGDPLYPYKGLGASVMGAADPVNPNGPRESVLAHEQLVQGKWHSLTMTYQGYTLQLLLDGSVIAEVTSSVFDLSEAFDWMINLGDGDSHAFSPCDVSIDNILLRIVSANSKAGAPESRQPLLRVDGVEKSEDIMEITISNWGNLECSGEAIITIGLSYDRNWIPEWETQFHMLNFGYLSIGSQESITIQVEIPETPDWAIRVFQDRQSRWWAAYEDKDPESDFLGFIITIGDEVTCGFYPID